MKMTSPELVAASLTQLRKSGIHPNFAGYLCVRRTAALHARLARLHPNFREFFDTFLHVPGGPSDKPYLRFMDPSDATIWFNPNVAGSYAPSSIRADNPFRRVVQVGSGRTATYSLRANHQNLARLFLTNGAKVPALPLSVFLYRDYALTGNSSSVQDWIDVFREEFGYSRTSAGDAEFDTLYTATDTLTQGKDWLIDGP